MRVSAFSSIVLGLAISLAMAAADPKNLADLKRDFQNPPDDARIMMRWWWFGPAVTQPELEREMRLMKEGGIGGFEVQPVYPLALDDPETGFHNSPYLSDEFLDALRFTAQKARELGLRMDLTLGSGWPFGGPHIPITQAAGRLRVDRVPVAADARSIPVPFINTGEKLIAVFLAQGDRQRFAPEGIQRLTNIDRGMVQLTADRKGPQVALFFIASRTGQTVKRPAIGAEGFVLDHYDRVAIENHLKFAGDRLLSALGSDRPYAVFSDSLEVYGSDWTGDLLEQFQKRRGYDLTPYLPALTGDIGDKTAAVRRDWGVTLTELLNERYLTPIREWAQKHGTRFRSQSYGIPPASLSSNALVDLPEGERSKNATRWASSASHLYGRPVTSSETWTWLHSPVFRATPLDMKVEADLHFLQGINQLIGHGWPYSPAFAGEPGWRFYAAAVFDEHNPWWLVMPDVTRYLQRVSFLLRQGQPANDVALYLPTDDACAKFTVGRDSSISQSVDAMLSPVVVPQILSAGFNFDYIDDGAIASVGIPYRALILPNVERIPLATYQKIAEYIRRGGLVVATGRLPSLAPGLVEAEQQTALIRALSRSLFRAATDESKLGETLAGLLTPDAKVSPEIRFIYRKLDFAEVYFLANTSNHAVQSLATFRVTDLEPAWWDPFNGAVTKAGVGAAVQLDLAPYESRVIVFSKEHLPDPATPRQQQPPINLSTSWTVTYPDSPPPVAMRELRSWTEDERTKYFSGQVTYKKTATVPESWVRRSVVLDFGEGIAVQPGTERRSVDSIRAWIESPVREAAVVYVNGQRAGSVWHPPYQVDVGGWLHAGANQIRVVVANLAINEMAHGPLPDYRLLRSRYGNRFDPQDVENLQPLPSGLLGPIRLVMRP
ncbi:MAG TPA: glycosyl hydrolase [Bryobacteraceae bacterium]|nr:glycosyl hydrolase [Bryobacteraceae bacterium]